LGVGALGVLQLALATGSGGPFDRAFESVDDHLPKQLTVLRSLLESWTSMKSWVKIWLFALNGLFLISLFFWPSTPAKLAIAAYIASSIWLMGVMIVQRGLTRLLGIAHLIAFLPLIPLLALAIFQDSGKSMTTTASFSALLAAIIICLALDSYDVKRWFSGETFRLGSTNAAKAGASKRAATKA
jgi:hypothetical protein